MPNENFNRWFGVTIPDSDEIAVFEMPNGDKVLGAIEDRRYVFLRNLLVLTIFGPIMLGAAYTFYANEMPWWIFLLFWIVGGSGLFLICTERSYTFVSDSPVLEVCYRAFNRFDYRKRLIDLDRTMKFEFYKAYSEKGGKLKNTHDLYLLGLHQKVFLCRLSVKEIGGQQALERTQKRLTPLLMGAENVFLEPRAHFISTPTLKAVNRISQIILLIPLLLGPIYFISGHLLVPTEIAKIFAITGFVIYCICNHFLAERP